MVIAAGMLSSPPSSLSDDDVNLADRKNALGRNLLLKEVEDLTARIETRKKANAPSWAIRPLERDLENLDRNVQGILICYDHILENDNLAMQEFSAVIADMGKQDEMGHYRIARFHTSQELVESEF
jgi:hypothetical protein